MNTNLYDLDPFKSADVIKSADTIYTNDIENLKSENQITSNIFGLGLMNTQNIRMLFDAKLSDKVEGVSGRWTLFTNLLNKANADLPSSHSTIFAVDSVQETKLGIGRTFASKKPIGMREMIVSSYMAEHLKVLVGDSLTLQYDFRLILNMAQRLSDEILPSLLTKELSQDELQDADRRLELALELTQFIADLIGIRLEDDG